MQQKIEDLETRLRQDLEQMNVFVSRKELESVERTSRSALKQMRNFLSVAEEQLRVTEEQLQFHKAREEEECHRVFRLKSGSKDATYEWYKDHVEERLEGTCQYRQHYICEILLITD